MENGSPLGGADDRIECPYGCGTVLTGIHAVGNLTRHLKSKACPNSPKSGLRYPCTMDGCPKGYARSDGLKVHMRRHHGAPAAPPKTGVPRTQEEFERRY
ncbi:hypothetical protein IQ06DRAFT_9089 [Phaeosphaeriaceae sp. SRC1lsM3a]|nr:hypothetical protein IQ06DRAFT_9089 [Stagonospora sp. SRC1lsM3a]